MRLSTAVVGVATMRDRNHFDDEAVFYDPIDNPILPASRGIKWCKRLAQRVPGTTWVFAKRAHHEFERSRRNLFWQINLECASCGTSEHDIERLGH